jgi:RimJ/RimL family protein N-acetyltransferase
MRAEPPDENVPRLETARTLMRGHRLSDFDACAAMWADQSVVRYITGRPSTRAEAWSRLLRHIGHWRALGFGYWVVEDCQTGEFLGEVGFADYKRDIDPPMEGVPEIGWVLAVAAQGRGLASEAAAAAVQWADRNLTAEKTACIMDPQHEASVRVARKNGYFEARTATFMGEPTLVMERLRKATSDR